MRTRFHSPLEHWVRGFGVQILLFLALIVFLAGVALAMRAAAGML